MKVKVRRLTFSAQEICVLREMVRQTCVLEMSRPLVAPGEYNGYETKKGRIDLENARYRTRIRRGAHVSVNDNKFTSVSPEVVREMKVVLVDEEGKEFVGDARKAKGRTTKIHVKNQLPDSLQSIRVIGRPEPTSSEKAADELLLLLLQGKATLRESLFIRDLWFPGSPRGGSPHQEPADELPVFQGLNESQAKAARAMISSSPKFVVVHGEYPFV